MEVQHVDMPKAEVVEVSVMRAGLIELHKAPLVLRRQLVPDSTKLHPVVRHYSTRIDAANRARRPGW